ncbi:Uncharacterized membrane protein YsdA, DUF1294 family [Pseudobutyrivibrio sp. C4]|uniref:DUF1294 domain-containing protein n=1 Tax=Pseudobutyrivibrio sp. C4 TaxID=1520803 RepID=UPI0008BCCCC1|nr:DUF1294 domain-containing protein [Pseudobutyrivibrio sp. C4]SET30478.1 Uncharacterized membrane protein YsdA, DUF1294 family [Pseudobutyrivibrio sp. C4]
MDRLILGYLVIANIAGLAVMGIDKAKAIKGAWRIPEKTLFLFSLIGGSIGTWAGMYLFHHKTKHWYFVIGMPAILIIQLVIAAYLTGLI